MLTLMQVYRSGGRFLSDAAVGHLGFTGTSIWLDPKVNTHDYSITHTQAHTHTHACSGRNHCIGETIAFARGAIAITQTPTPADSLTPSRSETPPPQNGFYVVILANAVHPSAAIEGGEGIRRVGRQAKHGARLRHTHTWPPLL